MLNIKTFSNATGGGNSVFKALSHPLAAPKAHALLERLKNAGPIAIYDPTEQASDFNELYGFSCVNVIGVYVQNHAHIGRKFLDCEAEPIGNLAQSKAKTILVAAFDSPRIVDLIRHMVPSGVTIITFDDLRLPDEFLTDKRNYLNTLNFATNFAFFREIDGHHTRVVTANYWSGYGAKNVALWFCLFDDKGKVLAQWREEMGSTAHIIAIDSQEVRKKHNLQPFAGSLFIHAINVAGHDIVKYALDTYGDDKKVLSCTHDANAWPADNYAGLPAPKKDENVILWIENSYPCPIPADTVGLNLMGSDNIVYLKDSIAPFATRAINVSAMMPEAQWPQQLEVQAGRHFVRPRYEVINNNGHQRIAHINVERSDLKPDPAIPGLANLMGKGYILPAPILPLDRYNSIALPTPMATTQENLPLALIIYDADGTEILRQNLGKIERRDSNDLDIAKILKENGKELQGGFGHMELIYDFSEGGDADGWLHGLFRYEDTKSGHTAETSFGAHIFNTVMVYKNEPQSYTGKPPGLSTRLFLRLGTGSTDTLCHLIYPASTPWHALSKTDLILFDRNGTELAKKQIQIPCSGSRLWRYSEIFSPDERAMAGDNAYVLIRDTTCRLFGYHGLENGDEAFSLDHMFGF
jgi:hypothetical protein